MCGSKNFRCVHACVCVWLGEVVHQAKQTVEEILKTFLRWGGILSPQLIVLRGSLPQTFPLNLRFSGGGGGGGLGPSPYKKSQVQWKNLELWNLGKS